MNEQNHYSQGDIVEHPVFERGIIITIDETSNVYNVKFNEIENSKPISFEFKGLQKVLLK